MCPSRCQSRSATPRNDIRSDNITSTRFLNCLGARSRCRDAQHATNFMFLPDKLSHFAPETLATKARVPRCLTCAMSEGTSSKKGCVEPLSGLANPQNITFHLHSVNITSFVVIKRLLSNCRNVLFPSKKLFVNLPWFSSPLPSLCRVQRILSLLCFNFGTF